MPFHFQTSALVNQLSVKSVFYTVFSTGQAKHSDNVNLSASDCSCFIEMGLEFLSRTISNMTMAENQRHLMETDVNQLSAHC